MFQQFLTIISGGEVQSQLDIAARMGISPDMAVQIAQDLAKRGYLEESGGDCCNSGSACDGCPASSGCQPMVRLWTLTEKGKKAISAK
jgi:hypothetical protein